MINNILLTPPLAFIVVLVTTLLLAGMLSRLSYKRKKGEETSLESYACGEEGLTPFIQPDYTQFFPFAFFFTMLHVIALIVATVPFETMESFFIAVIYIAGAFAGLAILFRR